MIQILNEVKSTAKFEKTPQLKLGKWSNRGNMAEKSMGLFNDIFVMPYKQKLQQVKEELLNIKDDESKKQDQIIKLYQEKEMKKFKIMEELKPDEALERMREITRKPDNYEAYNKSLLKGYANKLVLNQRRKENKMAESMNPTLSKKSIMETMTQSMIVGDAEERQVLSKQDKTIFQQQIQVEPPDLPNANSSSAVAPGLGWAPSIPYLVEDEKRVNLKDLLLRSRAGKKAGEVQEEAHLDFYLAMAYEEKKNYKKAIWYYTDYFKCAEVLQDKIGMAFARNRIGVNYHKLDKNEKSLENHKMNIELSDVENVFAGYYNAGISLRTLDRHEKALEYFNRALEWSLSKQDIETECLVNGQIGLTYSKLGDTELAVEYLEKCKDMSRHIKNVRLNLDALICLSRIKCKPSQAEDSQIATHPKEVGGLFKEALDFAQKLGDKKYTTSCIASLGILTGTDKFEDFINKNFSMSTSHPNNTKTRSSHQKSQIDIERLELREE